MGLKAVATLVPGGGAPVGGSGTPGTLAKFTGAGTSIGDSAISESGILISINAGVGTNMVINDGTGMAGPSYDGVRLCRGSEALFSSSDSVRTFRAGVTGATVVAGSTTSHDLLLQRGNVTALTLGASGAVAFAGNLTSSAAQTWTLAAGTSALNIASNLLNLDTTNSRVGIGTASPGAKLALLSTPTATVPAAAAGAAYSGVFCGGDAAGSYGVALGLLTSGAGYLQAQQRTGPAVTYDFLINPNGGNVGIGTTSPLWKNHTVGVGALFSGSAYNLAAVSQDQSTYRGISFGYDSSGQIGTIAATTGGAGSSLAFWTYSGAVWGERMRIDSAGNFAVGRVPTAGTIFETQGDIVSFRDAASNVRVRFEAANSLLNVGLGTTGWGLKLPATPGNTDSQTLDCYQENPLATTSGNGWTPTLSAAATWGGTQPNVTYARYVRMGSMVFCEVKLTIGAGTMTSTYGLTTIDSPFTTNANATHAAVPVAAPGASGVGFQTGTAVYLPTIGASSTFILAWSFFA